MFLLQTCEFFFHVLVVCTWCALDSFDGFLDNGLTGFLCLNLCLSLGAFCKHSPDFFERTFNLNQGNHPQLSAAVDWIAMAMKSLAVKVTMEALTRTVTLTGFAKAVQRAVM